MGQSGGFLSRLLEPLLKTGLPLMKNAVNLLAKSVLIPLRLTASASATDKKMFAYATASLIISNEKINEIMKIVQLHEESGLLIKGVSETIKNEARKQKGGFL